MAFAKGQSGNPSGKAPGTRNKVGERLRNAISDLLESRWEQLVTDIDSLEPKDRVRLCSDLLAYVVTKPEPEHRQLSDEDKIEILDMLEQRLHGHTQG